MCAYICLLLFVGLLQLHRSWTRVLKPVAKDAVLIDEGDAPKGEIVRRKEVAMDFSHARNANSLLLGEFHEDTEEHHHLAGVHLAHGSINLHCYLLKKSKKKRNACCGWKKIVALAKNHSEDEHIQRRVPNNGPLSAPIQATFKPMRSGYSQLSSSIQHFLQSLLLQKQN